MSINDMSPDIRRKILAMLAPKTQARLAPVCRNFHETINGINRDRINHVHASKKRTFTNLYTDNPTQYMDELHNVLKKQKIDKEPIFQT
ncbi:MAG TPA: F-box protein, partial [Chlamydiales bacterium]|nr:F-box protein [Chlamydiales bacterium]